MIFPLDSSKNFENSKTQYLRFHTNIKLGLISSATLVLHRNPKVLTKKILRKHNLLSIRIIGVPHRLAHTVGHPKIIESNRNWVKLDVTSLLKTNAAETILKNVSIEVTCKECEGGKGFLNSEKRRPFLIFNLRPNAKTRSKRYTTCSGSGHSATQSCCLVRYQINFDKIGYDFVVAPKTFYLNYCKGTCKRSTWAQIIFQTRVKILNLRSNNCCVVSKLQPLAILYLDNNGKLVKKDLPNVTAKACKCS